MYHVRVTPLTQSVLAYIRKHELLRPGDRVALAVSGGADSVALLQVLLEMQRELGLVLSVVHLNHGIRGAESDADEQFVRDLAARNDLPFLSERRDARSYAAERKLSLEAGARELRYEFFERLLRTAPLDRLATAHTLDDQAETVLLKLARGAGTRGLAGIYPQVSVGSGKAIVRPFLCAARPEIEQYLRSSGQAWREDSSNRDLRHTRNRIRHAILPRLEELNPSVREALAETAEIARAEEEFWADQIRRLLPQVSNPEPGGIRLVGEAFMASPVAVQRRLLRAAAESLGLHLEFRQVDQLLHLDRGGRIDLGGGWCGRVEKGAIHLHREALPPSEYCYELKVPGMVEVPEIGIALQAALADAADEIGAGALLDGRFRDQGLTVRNWRPGDRFWPPHAKHSRKVKELLQDSHVTGDEKKRWPVVASGGNILWLRGFGVARAFQASAGLGIRILEVPPGPNLNLPRPDRILAGA